jgi:hypothetical protein
MKQTRPVGFSLGHLTLIVIALLIVSGLGTKKLNSITAPRRVWWEVQSIDTMKYSRDLAREKLKDTLFDTEMDRQIAAIAATGATHVSIATPYDEEFIPIIARWVNTARKHNLSVWFRGNFAGWEGWFGYPRISRDQHKAKLTSFIENNSYLFANGDIFSACPECENGGPGDPRVTRDINGHRAFLIAEYELSKRAFAKLNKSVRSNFESMNGDVARLVMDRETTKALDGIVVIDHYVATPEKLVSDLVELANLSGGQIVLGEFGVPIPDLHGAMSEAQQAAWLEKLLTLLQKTPQLTGLNYWTHQGGTTALWKGTRPTLAVSTLTSFYSPEIITGVVKNDLGQVLPQAKVQLGIKSTTTSTSGTFGLVKSKNDQDLQVSAVGYRAKRITLTADRQQIIIELEPVNAPWWHTVFRWLRANFNTR